MVGLHLPGDPYFPNQGNKGWHNAEPEDDYADRIEEDFAKILT